MEPPDAQAEPIPQPTTATATTPTVETHYQSTGVWPAVVGSLVIAAIVVIFVAQNTHRVLMHFLWANFRMSPGVLVLATGLVAVAASTAAGAAWRARRRQVLAEREELVRLRETAAS
jgi:uncharacterized integral membrane protein